jgi:hypothetical protein
MAQTVALQRGTGSLGAPASTLSATLFTQSGGISTRVIFNQLAFYSTYTTLNSPSILLVHVSSNGSSNLVGWWKPSGSPTGGQLFPNPNGSGPTQTNSMYNTSTGASPTVTANASAIANNSTYNYPGVDAVNTTLYAYQNGAGSSYALQNFWIGPSDSVVIRYWEGNQSSGLQYAYHFVTITES